MNEYDLIAWGLNPKFITAEFLASIGCTATLPQRFVSKVTKGKGCWEWPWGDPYGTLGKGKAGAGVIGAHVTSFVLHFGPVEKGLKVCHTCDNPRCVRPDHLWKGTQAQNMADAANKGRAKNQSYEGQRRGDNATFRKLSSHEVLEIMRLIRGGGMSQEKIGARFGVSQSAVMLIKTGRSWSHLTGINSIRNS